LSKIDFGMSLEIFIYIGELLSDYSFYDSTSLIKAYLDVGFGKLITEGEEKLIGKISFLEDSPIQKTYRLTPYTLKVLIVVLWMETYVNLNVGFSNMVGL
jgi:hypothetical protein